MDKTLFLEVDPYGWVIDNMVYKFDNPYKGLDTDEYFNNVIKPAFIDIFTYYEVDTSKHISNIDYYIGEKENNTDIIFLRIGLTDGDISRKHIRNKIGVLQKIPETPAYATAIGATKSYFFKAYNITDNFDDKKIGVFLFTVIVEDARPNRQFSHSIVRFSSIADNNSAEINYAKQNGATHFFYEDCGFESERQRIITDIKNGENYKDQLLEYGHLSIP